jgi:outer membrane protein assembly factor BamA
MDRVGKVTIAGGSAADVPQLAVLEGTLDDAARTERVRLAAIDVLHTRGYPRAYVAVTRRDRCGVELDVAVVPGPRVRIVAIEFDAEDSFPADARLATIEDALGTVNAVGGAYVEDRLFSALAELQARYRAAGWNHAIVEPPHADIDELRGTVRLTITIRAGKRT